MVKEDRGKNVLIFGLPNSDYSEKKLIEQSITSLLAEINEYFRGQAIWEIQGWLKSPSSAYCRKPVNQEGVVDEGFSGI